MSDCLFCKIIAQQVPANIIHEDDKVIAFDDIQPKAPHHKLIIPRKHIATLNELTPEDTHLTGHLLYIAQQLAKKSGIAETGYRVVMNYNQDAGQAVYHIHMHLLGGRIFSWPPG